MKKILSALLSILMISSCLSISALAEGTLDTRPIYITYDLNGADGTFERQLKEYDSDIQLHPEIPTREHYTFLGWSRDKYATEPEYQPGDIYSENVSITLYAVWKGNTYTVTFNPDAGTTPITEKVVEYRKPYGELPKAKKHDLYFVGWFTSYKEDAQQITADTIVEITQDTTLYAQFDSYYPFTITYDANGGEDAPEPHVGHYGYIGDLITHEIAYRDGYTCIGWSEDKDATKAHYVSGNPAPYTDITLYAVWKANSEIWEWETHGDTVELTRFKGYGKDSSSDMIFLPNTIEGKPVAKISAAALSEMIAEEFITKEDHDHFSTYKGVLYDKNKETLVRFPSLSWATEWSVPSELPTYRIGELAFFHANNIIKLTLNENISKLEPQCFSGLDSLKILTILNADCYIDFGVFGYSSGLITIKGYIKSKAAEFVKSINDSTRFVFVFIGEYEVIVYPGDVNCDDNISMEDVTSLQKVIAKLVNHDDLGERSELNSDVNDDGYITMEDVTLIQRHIAHLIEF